MEIKHLKHKNIDKAKWDQCISEAPNGLVFGYSWWLDVLSPNWQALIVGDYEYIFPLTINNRMLFSRLLLPSFTQRLDIFSKNPISDKDYEAFLSFIIKKYKKVAIAIAVDHTIPGIASHYQTFKQRQCIDLSDDYETLRKRYSTGMNKNMKQVEKQNMTERDAVSVDEFVSYAAATMRHKRLAFSKKNEAAYRLLIQCILDKKLGSLSGIENEEGTLLATSLVYKVQQVLYHVIWPLPETKKYLSRFYIVDKVLQKECKQALEYDFGGSSVAGVRTMNEGFGASTKNYLYISKKWMGLL